MAEDPKAEGLEQAPSDQDEVQARAKLFIEEYGLLVQKHKIDFAQYPVWVPDGQGGFRTVMQNTPVDVTNQAQRSPFVPETK